MLFITHYITRKKQVVYLRVVYVCLEITSGERAGKYKQKT